MGYQPNYCCGYKRLSASGTVSDAGKPILIAGYSILSGSTAAVPYFNEGAALSGSSIAFRPGPVTVSVGNTISLPLPVMFPTGCYVSFDANTTEVTVFYILQSVTN